MTTTTSRHPRSLLYAVIAGSLVTLISLGVRSTFGLFLEPISDTLNTPRAVFALAVAIQAIVWGLGQPVAGAIADRFGAGRVLFVGSLIYAGGMAIMANATSSIGLYLSGGLVVGVGVASASFSVVLASVGRIASEDRRSLALGVVTAMGSVGQFLLIPATQRWIVSLGWETTVLALAAISLSMIVLIRPLRGSAAQQSASSEPGVPLRYDLARARRDRNFLLMNVAFFTCGFHVTFIGTHLPGYASDLGISGSAAATSLALIGLFNIGGSLGAGALGQRFSKTKVLSIIYAARGVVIAAFLFIPITSTSVIVFGAVSGLLWLSTVPLTSAIVAQQFGTTHSGTLFGIVFLSHQIGAFIGAWMGGFVVDSSGSYAAAWWTAAGLGVLAAVAHLVMYDGPVPPLAPGSRSRWRFAPATGALVLVVALAVGPFLGSGSRAVAQAAPYVCVIHVVPPG